MDFPRYFADRPPFELGKRVIFFSPPRLWSYAWWRFRGIYLSTLFIIWTNRTLVNIISKYHFHFYVAFWTFHYFLLSVLSSLKEQLRP